jgi:dTDP-4-amino-4,6-dideoxygalactose transaminase
MNIQLFVPTFDIEKCLAEIRECFEKGWTGLGFKTVELEEKWCEYSGLPYAHFLSSGTAALHSAIDVYRTSYNWDEGDEVITSPVTFVSSNHVILYERLKPVFADVDDTLCLDPADVERKITSRTRAVMFVGIGGNVGQFEAIRTLCAERGIKLILDAAHMAGTRFKGETPRGDATCYSFQAVKPLPTADSGMICFAEAEHDNMCRKKAWLGINKDTYARTSDKGAYRWLYDVEYVGYKYNGNSIMAAIALAQLHYLDRDNAYRRQIATWYDEGFDGCESVGRIPTAQGCESSRHLYQIHVSNRDELMLALNESDIFPGVHYRDNREYRMYQTPQDTCPNASRLTRRIMSLPIHQRMTRDDVSNVVRRVIAYAR